MSSTHPRGRHPPIQAEERMAMVGGGLSPSVPSILLAQSPSPPQKKAGLPFPLPRCLLGHCLLRSLSTRQRSSLENPAVHPPPCSFQETKA